MRLPLPPSSASTQARPKGQEVNDGCQGRGAKALSERLADAVRTDDQQVPRAWSKGGTGELRFDADENRSLDPTARRMSVPIRLRRSPERLVRTHSSE
jgi:hypothetical protein